MTNTATATKSLSYADVAFINSQAVPCDGCGLMHWDAYETGRCASCSSIEEMRAALVRQGVLV